jgi:hypothetical protein
LIKIKIFGCMMLVIQTYEPLEIFRSNGKNESLVCAFVGFDSLLDHADEDGQFPYEVINLSC